MSPLAAFALAAACCALPVWDFDGAGLPAGWQPNAGIPQAAAVEGELRGHSTGSDSFFVIGGIISCCASAAGRRARASSSGRETRRAPWAG